MNNVNPMLFHYNLDENGEPKSIDINGEQNQISSIHYSVQLKQRPDEKNNLVVIDDLNNTLSQVEDMEDITENTYYVDYHNALVYFHRSKAGKTFVFNYWGVGYELIGASRVYDEHDVNGQTVVKTLQEIIDRGRECIDALNTIGNAIELLKRIENYIIVATELDKALKEDIKVGNQLHIDLTNDISTGSTLHKNLTNDITVGDKLHNNLTNDISTGTTLDTNLKASITEGNTTKSELDKSRLEAQDDIATIKATGNGTWTIPSSAWVGTEPNLTCVINHKMNSKNLIVNVVDTLTQKSMFADFRVIDANNIEMQSMEACSITVVINARYYSGKDANTVQQEIIDARKGEINLKSKIDLIDTAIQGLTSTKQEVINARKGKATLESKIDEIDSIIFKANNEIASMKDNIARLNRYSSIHMMSALSLQTNQNESDDFNIIRTIDNKIAIIDCGEKNTFNFYKSKLDKLGITKINWLLFTHQHSDHCGNYDSIIRTYRPEKIYLRTVNFDKLPQIEVQYGTKALHQGIIQLATELNIPVVELLNNQIIELSSQENIKVLYNSEDRWDDYNYLSCAFLYSNQERKVLFAGDLQHGSADTNIISQLPVLDVLKVAHHGIGSIVEMPIIKSTKPIYSILTSHLNSLQPICSNRIISTGSEVKLVSENDGVISFILADNVISTSARSVFIKTVYPEGSNLYCAINGVDATNSVQNIKGKEYVVLSFGKIAKGSFVVLDYPNYDQYAMPDGSLARGQWIKYTDAKWYYAKYNGIIAKDETLWIEGQNHTFNAEGQCTTRT